MAIIYPACDRAVIETDGATLRITIPVARTHWQDLCVPFCVAFSGGCLALLIESLWRGPAMKEELIVLILVFCVISVGTFLWYRLGKEIIEIDATTLKRIRQIPFLRKIRSYSIAKITNLRPAVDMKAPSWLPAQRSSETTFGGGRIAFDYGRRTHRLGIELSDADTAPASCMRYACAWPRCTAKPGRLRPTGENLHDDGPILCRLCRRRGS